ncbi:MAG: nucleoside monophosphate kinase [Desulfosudaceae bacterium]
MGDYLETHGLNGRSCAHFDFGAQLRKIADQGHARISPADRNFIIEVLTCGALLEKDRLPLAAAIFQAFIQDNRVTPDRLLILNGLPRHVEQARFMSDLVDVRQVLHLCGSPEVVCCRIRKNTGGDRTGRTDDIPDAITRKIKIFRQRTLPLLGYYRDRGVPIDEYPVTGDSSAPDMADFLFRTKQFIQQPA